MPGIAGKCGIGTGILAAWHEGWAECEKATSDQTRIIRPREHTHEAERSVRVVSADRCWGSKRFVASWESRAGEEAVGGTSVAFAFERRVGGGDVLYSRGLYSVPATCIGSAKHRAFGGGRIYELDFFTLPPFNLSVHTSPKPVFHFRHTIALARPGGVPLQTMPAHSNREYRWHALGLRSRSLFPSLRMSNEPQAANCRRWLLGGNDYVSTRL
ncbi:hypothetical protein C8R45DRAFT_935006 [Mycena sanguinolenta]|nr:hypothetical protein C8R45DRAFT_935006 [Mycena sanguinolenta]